VQDDGRISLLRDLPDGRFQEPLSGLYGQIDVGGQSLRSRSLWDEQLNIPDFPSGSGVHNFDLTGPAGQKLKATARRLSFDGVVGPAVVAVAGERTELDREIARFNRIVSLILGAIAAGLVVSTALVLKIGLRPLGLIGRRLGEIRSGRRERLEDAYPSEVQPLVDELNALIEQQAQVVARARTAVANLSHGLKTPLSVLTLEAGRGEGPLADAVRKQTAAMRGQVERHLTPGRAVAAGQQLGVRTEVRAVLDGLRSVLTRLYAEREIEWHIDCEAALAFRGERQDLEEMLGNLLENACKWTRTRVEVGVTAAGGDKLEIAIRDDGPGIDDADKVKAQERGQRLDEQVPGSGHGLAIVHEIAELYGGGLDLADAEGGGLRATLSLPLAA
jgi:signal transduction histidine kinase